MENTKVLEKTENKNLEKTEKTAEKTGNVDKRNMETIAKLVMEKIESIGVDLSGISELNQLSKEILELNLKIQKLSEERLQKISQAKEIFAKLNDEAKRLLEFLGLLNTAEIERAIGINVQTAKTTIQRASRGNGLSGKRIVFQGKTYNIAHYFMQKMNIQGGLSGLLDWAKKNGFTVKQNENEIIIT